MKRTGILPALVAVIAMSGAARAGVVNPDISVIGQPVITYTDDKASPDAKRARLDPGETEFVFDAYLNPSAKGNITLSLSDTGIELEEGYFLLLRGLPAGLTLKGGKYRVGFGKLNAAHPHTYPFAERFHVLSTYLPGTESLNETGLSISGRLPAPGEISLTATGDWLQGDTFRIARASSGPADDSALSGRPAFVGRLAGFVPSGDRSGVELGLSAAGGTNNVAARARTRLYGADVKAKLWRSENSYLVLQGELVSLDRDDAGWNPADGYTRTHVRANGGYAFADCQLDQRHDLGASYERFQEPSASKPWSQAVGLFGGYAIMEETTVFRLGWEHFDPASADAVNNVTFRVIYSMGPHKAHQF